MWKSRRLLQLKTVYELRHLSPTEIAPRFGGLDRLNKDESSESNMISVITHRQPKLARRELGQSAGITLTTEASLSFQFYRSTERAPS